jgi:predicted Zn-dependent protease
VTNLDLTRHGIEEIPGKYVMLGGARYRFEDLVGEGGEKYVFSLKNVQSGLILYVAKIYKYKPESTEAQELAASLAWKMFALVQPKLALYTEIHQTAGAVIELQPYGVTNNAEFCAPLMDRAMTLQENDRWEEACIAFDEVLRTNPHHSMARLNKAAALFNVGHVKDAIDCAEQAIRIEPNFPESYRVLSKMLLAVFGPDAALRPLRRTLDRYAADPLTWELLLQTTVDYDLADAATHALQEVYRIGSRPSGERPREFTHFEYAIKESTRRWTRYCQLLAVALDDQSNARWPEALARCEEARQCSKNNTLAALNAFICRYHLGAGAAIAEDLLGILHRFDTVELAPASSLAMLCASLANRVDDARRLAFSIAGRFSHYVDVPAVPIGVSIDGAVLEARSARPIVELLRIVGDTGTWGERWQLKRLRKLYEKRETAFRRE